MKNRYKRERRTGRFLNFIAFVCCSVSLFVAGYFFLFHEDSKTQQWLSSIESYFEVDESEETEDVGSETK